MTYSNLILLSRKRITNLIRSNPFLYRIALNLLELQRKSKSAKQEVDYVRLREYYYSKAPSFFKHPGYLTNSHNILYRYSNYKRALKESLKEVRIFIVAANTLGAVMPFKDLGRSFNTISFDYGDYVKRIWSGDFRCREKLQNIILDIFFQENRKEPFDIAFISATHSFVSTDTLEQIRKSGTPVALLNADDKLQFLENKKSKVPNGQKPLIGSADVHLTNSIETTRWYFSEGAAAFYFPMGYDAEEIRPIHCAKEYDVSFIGGAYGIRPYFIEKLRKVGIQVSCFGWGWGTKILNEDEKICTYNASRINLGFGGTGLSEKITCVKGRDLEIPGSGNLYLTTYDYELSRMWTIGKEILCYFNEFDCVEQIRYYLQNPNEADEIAYAARIRGLREHTWTANMVKLLKWMGILSVNAE